MSFFSKPAAKCRRTRQELKVGDGSRTVSDTGTNAVVTSITTTNDNNILALGRDVRIVGVFGIKQRLGVGREEVHGEVNSVDLSVRQLEVSRPGRSSSNNDSVVVLLDLQGIGVDSDVGAGNECDTFSGHEIYTSLDNILVELHVGDTECQNEFRRNTAGFTYPYMRRPPMRSARS